MKFCHEHCRFTLWGTWMPGWSGWFGRMVRTEDLSGSLCFGKLLRRRCCCMKHKMMAWSTSKRSKNAAWMYSRVWAWEPQAKGSRTWWRCGNRSSKPPRQRWRTKVASASCARWTIWKRSLPSTSSAPRSPRRQPARSSRLTQSKQTCCPGSGAESELLESLAKVDD